MRRFRNSNPARLRRLNVRKGALVVVAAILLVVVFAFTAFTVDVGYMNLLKGELQNAADAAALAAAADLPDGQNAARTAATDIAAENTAAGGPVTLTTGDIEFGTFNFLTKQFNVGGASPNAVRVTARANNVAYFFAPVMGQRNFNVAAQSIGMLNPRDIVFVVDTSGSMNDDTEPCWATDIINSTYSGAGYPTVASDLMAALYQDFGFGTFPGQLQYLGYPLGVASNDYTFAEMSKDDGPLADAAMPAQYRILTTDDEATRKIKTYSWVIDNQIATLMPNAKPTPDSTTNYLYWEKYIDYIMDNAWIGEPPPPDPDDGSGGGGSTGGSTGGGGSSEPDPPTPPAGNYSLGTLSLEQQQSYWKELRGDFESSLPQPGSNESSQSLAFFQTTFPGCPRRGTNDYLYLPPNNDGDRIYYFNNPNVYTFPSADTGDIYDWRNKIGYFTYVQYMMDWGRDRSPASDNATNADPALAGKTPLSALSPDCPYHTETTAGGTFSFPPREQPMHATRRALIAALQVVRQQNAGITNGAGDRVAIVTFDALDAYHAPRIEIGLTADYSAAMSACTTIQSVSDIGNTTAIEAGLITARNHLKSPDDGGFGRDYANKVIVLLTDGVPNVWTSTEGQVSSHILSNPSAEYYAPDYIWYNSVLMQADLAREEETHVYAVGVGLGADYDFMDRIARLSLTDEGGLSPRGSGNPAEYEQRMSEIFGEIIQAPGARIVE
ncbi:MAG: VWA domain-containing protein [Planctomycetaceae bacterium]|nr:VWA domain-containing protein [Planctomycetaceae bacterium]